MEKVVKTGSKSLMGSEDQKKRDDPRNAQATYDEYVRAYINSLFDPPRQNAEFVAMVGIKMDIEDHIQKTYLDPIIKKYGSENVDMDFIHPKLKYCLADKECIVFKINDQCKIVQSGEFYMKSSELLSKSPKNQVHNKAGEENTKILDVNSRPYVCHGPLGIFVNDYLCSHETALNKVCEIYKYFVEGIEGNIFRNKNGIKITNFLIISVSNGSGEGLTTFRLAMNKFKEKLNSMDFPMKQFIQLYNEGKITIKNSSGEERSLKFVELYTPHPTLSWKTEHSVVPVKTVRSATVSSSDKNELATRIYQERIEKLIRQNGDLERKLNAQEEKFNQEIRQNEDLERKLNAQEEKFYQEHCWIVID